MPGKKSSTSSDRLLLGTRKGLLLMEKKNSQWKVKRESFLGVPVPFAFHDRRSGLLWASLDHGHWGAKLHKSSDLGKTWDEVPMPAFPDKTMLKDDQPAKVQVVWYIAPAGETADGAPRLLFGTIPGGLFCSDDHGASFSFVESLWQHPSRQEFWFGGGKDAAGLSSLFVDPRDQNKIFVGASCGGVFYSPDDGKTWEGRNKGLRADFMPDPYSEFGHDPHYMTYCESEPDVLWQQNHCGIFRSKDGGLSWKDVSEKKGPAKFGWAIVADPDCHKTAWVVPAVKDEMRIAIDGALCVCRTEDGGKSWKTLRKGLPQKAVYDIVYRHGLDLRKKRLAFGSTTGNLYVSGDRGDSWKQVASHLPPIYSVRFL